MADPVYGIALSGLNAARAGLATTSHNIANANTVGFNRQQVRQEARASTGTDAGFVGQGVDIASVERVYSDFINGQLQKATSDSAFFSAKSSQVNQVDATIADESTGLSTALSNYFSAAQTLATSPGDLSARQNYLSAAQTLASRFNGLDDVMQSLRTSTNLKVTDTVQKINDATSQIAELNERIVAVASQNLKGSPPNDLLDQRDALIMQLAEQVQVTRVNLSDGSVNLFLASGTPLVVKTSAFQVSTQTDPNDPENLIVGSEMLDSSGNTKIVSFDGDNLGKGALAGFLSFRENELTQFQNTISLMAARVGEAVNNIQAAGRDLNGAAGTDLFSFGSGTFAANISKVIPNSNNSTSNPTSISVNGFDLSKLGAQQYEVMIVGGVPQYRELGSNGAFTPATLNAPNYEIRDNSNNMLVSFGLSNATPTDGDSFVLSPISEAAKNMTVALSLPEQIAAAGSTGTFSVGDNTNMLDVVALQKQKTLYQANGASGVSISDGFNQLVSKIGNKAREFTVASESRKAVLDQVNQTRDSLSGVNMDEEAANLIKFQQAYQASGRVIALSKEMFEQVLGLF